MPKAQRRAARQKAVRVKGSSQAALKTELTKPICPGEILFAAGDIEMLKNRHTKELTVKNSGDRPIQIGSHCHFFEVNRWLLFDREQAFGFRLCIPAGTAARFEPGEEKRVILVALAGNRVVYGINGLTNGALDDAETKVQALAGAAEKGFIVKR
jgi:urease beta subunit